MILPEKFTINARIRQIVARDVLQLAYKGTGIDAILMWVFGDVHGQLAGAGAKGEEAFVLVERRQIAIDQLGVIAHTNGVSADFGNVRFNARNAAQLIGQVFQPGRFLSIEEFVEILLWQCCKIEKSKMEQEERQKETS